MFALIRIALLAAAAPAFAWSTEGLFDLAPCALCLWQRWPYWVAAGLALAAVFIKPARRLLGGLAVLAILGSAAVAALHVGVEQGWWPSPLPGCRAPVVGGGGSLDAMLQALPAKPNKPCDAPTYLIPGLPLSMAAMNLLYALGLAGLASATRPRQERA
jgi:disulfide bond formation protein DsbB